MRHTFGCEFSEGKISQVESSADQHIKKKLHFGCFPNNLSSLLFILACLLIVTDPEIESKDSAITSHYIQSVSMKIGNTGANQTLNLRQLQFPTHPS
jgi:hypothetical protein